MVVKARRGQEHRCKSGKGKEQKDDPIFQRGMTFFVFERLFTVGSFTKTKTAIYWGTHLSQAALERKSAKGWN